MKAQLIGFSVLSVVAFLAWFGWQYLVALGAAFGNANRSTGPGDVGWVYVVVGLATAACAVGVFFVPASAGRIVALAPLVLIGLAHGYMAWRAHSNAKRYWGERAAARVARERKLEGISRDFVAQGSHDAYQSSFLTHDREASVIVMVDVGWEGEAHAVPVGKIDGAHLDLAEQIPAYEKVYRKYVDAEGKTLFDRYTLRFRPGQDLKAYRLERYKN